MRFQTLQGFTMWADGVNYDTKTEEVSLPLLTPMMQEYRGGGMALAVNLTTQSIEALEATVKISDQDKDILKLITNVRRRFTFRAAVRNEDTGIIVPHVCSIEGVAVPGSRDAWRRGEKVGIEFRIVGIIYMRYDAGDELIHEISASPARLIIDGVDLNADINRALAL